MIAGIVRDLTMTEGSILGSQKEALRRLPVASLVHSLENTACCFSDTRNPRRTSSVSPSTGAYTRPLLTSTSAVSDTQHIP